MIIFQNTEEKYKPLPEGEEIPDDAYASEHLKRMLQEAYSRLLSNQQKRKEVIRHLTRIHEDEFRIEKQIQELKNCIDKII